MKVDIHKIIFIVFAVVFILYFLVCFAYTYFPSSFREGASSLSNYSVLNGVDCNGNDIRSNGGRRGNPNGCAEDCNSVSNCYAWALNGDTCHMKYNCNV